MILPNIPETVLAQKVDVHNTKDEFRNLNGIARRWATKFDGSIKGEFERRLKDDTFNFIFDLPKIHKVSKRLFPYPFFSLNNPKIPQINETSNDFFGLMSHHWNRKIKIPHSRLNNYKFSDIETTIIGAHAVDYFNNDPNHETHNFYESFGKWTTHDLTPIIRSSFDKAIHIKIPKIISVDLMNKQPLPYDPNLGSGFMANTDILHQNKFQYQPNNVDYKINQKYQNYYIIPHKPDWKITSPTIAEIYVFDETDKDGSRNKKEQFDYDIEDSTDGVLKTSSIKSMPTKFIKDYQSNKKYITKKGNMATYIGRVDALDTVYYDFDQSKVVRGFGAGDTYADMVPYGFKGLYKWDLKLSLNSVIKNIHVNLSENIEKPFLDKDEGIVELKVKKHEIKPENRNFILSPDDIKSIKESKEEISLEKIKKMGSKHK